MTDLLTHAEYQAIAQDLDLPTNAFIDGKYQSARSKKTFASVNPATGKTIAKVAACDARDVDLAVRLRSALSTPNLRRSADATRGALLDSRIGQNLAVSRVDFPRGETRGSGNVVIFFSSTGNSYLVEYEIGITIV